MKRLFTTFLAFIYMGTSIGATINLHYCMGKLADWTFSASNSNTCPKCGMEKSLKKGKHCCSDEQKTLKSTSDQKATNLSFQAIYSIAASMPSAFLAAPANRIVSITEDNPLSNAPPLEALAIYICNHNFRI